VHIEQYSRDGCTIVAVHGRLDLAGAARLGTVLRKRLAEQPVAVICDLSGLWAVDQGCTSVFVTAAHRPASTWPGINLLLCDGQPAVAEVLCREGLPRFVRLLPSVDGALAEAFLRPPYLREQLGLPHSPAAPGAARRFVREVCHYWRLDDADDPADAQERAALDELIDRAVLLASELVTNAVLHGGGDVSLRMELQGERLHLAVADQSPWQLRLASPAAVAEQGRGLLVVERLATAWGVSHQPEGGKVVWCVLDRAWPATN
jgi:anti-sigma regulatory factor (Ser/Thr protein kinase)/anti-anti-sigma regulatory factor